MENKLKLSTNRFEWLIAALFALGIFVAFTFWSGVPTDERANIFWLFVVLLLIFSTGFVAMSWHLMFRPLPERQRAAPALELSVGTRQFLSLLLAIGGLCLVVGPFWDEIWHRQYGIPFGEDFFWRPHLLLYFGFGAGVMVGFWALSYVAFRSKGSFQQRMRATPLIGLVILSSLFLMYVVPADPVWHMVYGRDLSAWSIPHILLLISIAIVMLMAAIVHLSTVPVRQWQGIHKISAQDILPLLMFAAMMMPWLQILILDWDQAFVDPARLENRFRPEWLMAANIVFTATFAGVIANRSLRRVGAATVTGILALIMRYLMIQIFGVQETTHYDAWILALAPMIAIDVWMAYKILISKSEVPWYTTGIAAAVGMLIAAPLLTALYPFLPIVNIVVFAAAVLVAGLSASWIGTNVGEYAAVENKQLAEQTAFYMPGIAIGTLVTFLIFVVIFINTAPPPV